MAKFDWNEIVVTNDANIANGQVKDRMILVTGEKGDKGDDGRGILQVQKTSSTATYDVYTIYYSDGTKSTFSIDIRTGDGMNTNKIYMYSVNEAEGSDDNIGSYDSPFKTLRRAIEAVPVGCVGTITIVAEGKYGPNTTIDNRIISILLYDDNIDLENLNIRRSHLSIEAGNHPFTTGTITAEKSKFIITGDNNSAQAYIKTYGNTAITLDNTEFVNNCTTKFEIMGSGTREGINAKNLSRVSLTSIEFVGIVVNAISAYSGSIIRYGSMSGDDTILHRELCYSGGIIYHLAPWQTYTIYVDGENGNNSNTGLSENSALKSLQVAIDLLKNDNSEIVLLGGNCGSANIENKTVTLNVQSNDASVGTLVVNNSKVFCNDTLRINANNQGDTYGITANKQSQIYLHNVEFIGGTFTAGLVAENGSVIAYNLMSGDVFQREVCNSGGFIYSGILGLPHTYYVDGENGSNENTGKAQNSPFKTIKQAIDLIPNNTESTIVLLGGFCENVAIENKKIIFDIQSNTATVGKITASNSEILCNEKLNVVTDNQNAITLNNTRFSAINGIAIEMTNESSRYAITANDMSVVYLNDIEFNGTVTTALTAQTGSIIRYNSMSGNDTIANREVCYTGGIIYHDIPNNNLTYFVDGENGNNNNTGLSANSPFKSLQYAVNQIPDNCYSVISLLNGNCGSATIEKKKINFDISNNQVVFGKITLNNSDVIVNGDIKIETSEENGIILNHSNIHISNNIDFEMTNESGRYAITANDLSRANFRNITFTGEVTTGIIAQTGSIVCYLSMSGNDTIVNREICYTGGFIYRLTPGISHTYYVDGTNGSNNNAGISSDSPFKTLQYAVNQIPDNCYSVINLLNGNCGDTSLIDKLVTLNVDNENVIVGDLTLNRSKVDINNENQLLVVGAIEATESTLSYVDEIKIITDKERGISLINSRFYAKGAITFEMTNTSNRNAIYARYASHAYFSRIHCHGDMTTVIYSGNGSIVGYMSLDGDGRIGNEEVKEYGGRIYSGSQDDAGSKIIAEDFDNSKNYHIDEYVIYNNDLYRFIADHDAGDWNRNLATKIYATDEFIRLRNPQDGKLYARRNNQWEEVAIHERHNPVTVISGASKKAFFFEDTKNTNSEEFIVELQPTLEQNGFKKYTSFDFYGSASKNLIDLYNNRYGLPYTESVGGVSVTTNADGSVTLNGTASSWQSLNIGYVKNCNGINLRITGAKFSEQGQYGITVSCDKAPSGGSTPDVVDEGNGAEFVGDLDNIPVWINFSGEFQNVTFYPMVRIATFGDDEYDNPRLYTPENVETIDLSNYDIYGGYVNLRTGWTVKTWEHIASYNGEEITEEWMSNIEGDSPTTGSEVIYKLENPIAYQLTSIEIPTFTDKTTVILNDGEIYIKKAIPLDDYAKIINEQIEKNNDQINKKADKVIVAPIFRETENYSERDYVLYSSNTDNIYPDYKLYKFTSDHSAGAWNPSDVEETTIAAELGTATGKNIDSIVLSETGADYDTYIVTFNNDSTLEFQIAKDGYTKQQIDDAFYTKQAVDNFLFNKADAIKEYGTRTVKGKEIYIPAGATVTDFKVYLEPFQTGEGEPSATNIQPIYETGEVEIQKKNIGGNWTDAISIIAKTYQYNGQSTYGNIVDYINKKSYSSWALIPSYAGHQLPGRWISDRDVYSDFAPTGQPSVGAQVAYEKATPESPEDLLYVDMKNYNFNRSEPYLLRAHYWHEYSQYDAEFVMEITYNANVPVDTKTYIDDKHDALREEMYSNLGTITTENTSDTHWMKLENTLSNQVIKKLQIEYKPSLTSIDWIEVDIKNRNLIQTQFGYSGVTWKGVTFTQNEDDSISFTGTPTQDIDLDIGYVTGMPVGQYYISGGINTNCYIYILGASNIKSTGNDTLFTANQFIGSLPLELHITNTGEEVSGTFFPMVRFKDDDGTYIKPVYKASLWERLGTELDRKPAYGFSYDFVTATLTETWKHIDSYNFDPNPFPRRWIADNYGSNGPYQDASVTYELVEPEVREEDNKYTNQHLVDGVTYLFANNSNIVISEVNAQIRIEDYVDDFVEDSISGKADKTEVYTKTQTDDLISGKADKTEVYTKTQTDTLISNINNFAIHVCASGEYDNTTHLPTIANPEENTFYLVPTGTGTDIFDEWIYVNNAWEKFGSSRIDLTSYYTKAESDNLIDTKVNESVIAESFDATKNYQIGDYVIDDNKLYKITQAITSNLKPVVLKSTTSSASLPLGSHFTFDGKLYETMVDNFSFEYNILTEEDLARYISENKVFRVITTEYAPGGNYSSGKYVTYDGNYYTVKNSGIYTGFDSSSAEEVIVANEINSIETNLSNFYTKTETNTLLSAKQDTLTFDTAPTANSANPVTSGGLKTVIDKKANLASPTFTGTPKAPTPTAGNNTTQIATTAFVKTAVDNKTTSWGEVLGVLSDQTDLQDVLNLKADKTTTYTKTETDAIFEEKANEAIITEEWSNLKHYSAGDIVLHNHELYKFNSGFSPNVEQIIINNTINKYTYKKDDLFLDGWNVYRYVSDSTNTVASAPIQSQVLNKWLTNGYVVVVNTPDYTQGNTYEVDDIVKVDDKYYLVTVAGSYVEWNPTIVTKITVIGTLGTMAKFDDAPNDGNMYVRQNGQWVQLNLS